METLLSLFSNVFYIIIALLVLMFMITVHEFGHFVAGKILKFKINEFAIGFGPAIYKKTSKTTGEIFSVRCLPIGGFCALSVQALENVRLPRGRRRQPQKHPPAEHLSV
jgi:regulator of sigma E protease